MIANDIILAFSFTLAFISLVAFIFTDKKILFGIITAILLIFFYRSNILNGTADLMTVLIFISGVILLTLELFIPSFGIIGLAGIALTVYSLFDAFDNNKLSLIVLFSSAAAIVISVTIFVKLGFTAKVFDKFVLADRQSKERGFNSKKDYSFLIGQKGTAKTILRPTGVVVLDGKQFDAKAEGDFIQKGKNILVTEIKDGHIIVKEDENI
jgi:membrane-bound ClpP family serine protease